MRLKVALFFRKFADFLDPTIKPSLEPMTIEVKCDTSEAVKQIERLITAWKELPGITVNEARGKLGLKPLRNKP